MLILAIDTSNQPLTIAIIENNQLIAELTTNTQKTHGEALMPAIDNLMKQTTYQPKDLDRIVVSKGPGSYTGLRIGITTAKTLAWTLDIDLVGISSLEAIASNISSTQAYIVPIFDARRENIYTGLYAYESNQLVQLEDDTHVPAESWANYLNETYPQDVILVGKDAAKFIGIFKKCLSEKVTIAQGSVHLPRGENIAKLGRRKEAENIHTFTPAYLKITEAEENWLKENPQEEPFNYVEKN